MFTKKYRPASLLGGAVVFLILSILSLYMEAALLDSNKLAGVNTNYDNFLRWTPIVYIIIMFGVIPCIFTQNLIMRGAVVASFGITTLYTVVAWIIVVISYRNTTNGYRYVFETENYEKKGIEIQNALSCCGWSNVSMPVEGDICEFTKTCSEAIANALRSRNFLFTLLTLFIIFVNVINLFQSYQHFEDLRLRLPQYEELMQKAKEGTENI